MGAALDRLRLDEELGDGFAAAVELVAVVRRHERGGVLVPWAAVAAQLEPPGQGERYLDRVVGVEIAAARGVADPQAAAAPQQHAADAGDGPRGGWVAGFGCHGSRRLHGGRGNLRTQAAE
jgi:hypothetical protein